VADNLSPVAEGILEVEEGRWVLAWPGPEDRPKPMAGM